MKHYFQLLDLYDKVPDKSRKSQEMWWDFGVWNRTLCTWQSGEKPAHFHSQWTFITNFSSLMFWKTLFNSVTQLPNSEERFTIYSWDIQDLFSPDMPRDQRHSHEQQSLTITGTLKSSNFSSLWLRITPDSYLQGQPRTPPSVFLF